MCWPGEFGFLELEYIGKAPDERTWKGLDTGVPYRFGPNSVKLVDKADALKFLTPLGGGKAFKLARTDEDDQTEKAEGQSDAGRAHIGDAEVRSGRQEGL